MGRPLRTDEPGAIYHVVNRGAARQDIFYSDRDRVEFGRVLGMAHDRFGSQVHAYCLMTNHFHLMLECPNGGLSDAMQLAMSTFVRHVNERIGRDGPLFRGRFFARPITTEAYAVATIRYIHRNPLAFVPDDQLVSYRWSSLRAHLRYRRAPEWLRTDLVEELIGGPDRMLALIGDEAKTDAHLDLGDDWGSVVDMMVEQHLPDEPVPRISRTVLSSLLDRVEAQAAADIESLLGFPNMAAQRSARSRARRRLREDPRLWAVADAVLDLVA